MHFTYNSSQKIFELRNSMNSTVKRISILAIIYDSKSYELVEYGEYEAMNERLRSYADRKMYSKEMIRSTDWDLEVLNKLINGDINFWDIDQRLIRFANTFKHTYYRDPKGFIM